MVVLGGVALGGMCALTIPFVLSRAEVPTALILIGRWLPAAASLVALRVVRHEGRVTDWWQLRPGGPRRLLSGTATAVGVSAALAAATVGLGRLIGIPVSSTLPGPGELVVIALVTTLVATVSTLGEEVAWRGHLRQLTRPWGSWVSALGISAFWAGWHVPLHASYVAAGVMPVGVAAASTVALLASGPLWAALVERFDSIWPAVFAHAFPITPLVLVGDLGRLEPWQPWALIGVWTGLSWVCAAVLRTGRSPQASAER